MFNVIDIWLFSFPAPVPLLMLTLVMCIAAISARLSGALTWGGAFGAFCIGLVATWMFGFGGLALLLLFFLSANLLGKISRKTLDIPAPSSGRKLTQVLANGLLAMLCAVYYGLEPGPIPLMVFGAVLAEATADTWASEVGALSKVPPKSLVTHRHLPRGRSGGVTALGTLAAILGSFVIAVCWIGCFDVRIPGTFLKALSAGALIWVAGFIGCLVDSLLGALLQAQYHNPETEELVEQEWIDGKQLNLVRGLHWMDNDMVNLLSSLSSALFTVAIGFVLF